MSNAIDRIQNAISQNKICLFMKGNRNFPQCGFSAATVQMLDQVGAEYATVDVLSDPELRDQIKTYSNWPTIPQVYVNGKFIGGCDIMRELYESGELKTLVEQAGASAAAAK
jgi:monothiol glutaredoxin